MTGSGQGCDDGTAEAAPVIGFVGTGEISAAVIRGLSAAWGARYPVVVSPRSADVSAALAAEVAHVRRAGSNDEVVEAADIVCLGFRPQDLGAILPTLAFRDGQTVVSFLAGVDAETIAGRIDADVRVCRLTPLPMVAERRGPLVLYPALPDLRAILAPLGTLIEARSAEEMALFGYASGLMSSYFAMLNEGVDWLGEHGLARESARDYLAAMFAGLSETALATPAEQLGALPGHHETAGGINECARETLRRTGWIRGYRAGLDAIAERSAGFAAKDGEKDAE